MRVTNQIVRRDVLAHIQANHQAIAASQMELASGRRLRRASDDPNAAAQTLQLRGALRASSQYRRNIDAGLARLSAEETALDQLTSTLGRARELAVGQGSDTASAQTRLMTKAEVDNLLASARTLGNTSYLGAHLFGGHAAERPPFDLAAPPFASRPPAGEHQIEVSAGQRMPTTHDGAAVFLDTGALQALHDLSTALGADDAAAIRAAGARLVGVTDRVQALLGDVGARTSQLDAMGSALGSLSTDLEGARASLEDADMEQATMQLMSRQTTLQAALLTTQRLLSVSLTDYLR